MNFLDLLRNSGDAPQVFNMSQECGASKKVDEGEDMVDKMGVRRDEIDGLIVGYTHRYFKPYTLLPRN